MVLKSLWILLATLLFALTAFFVKLASTDFSFWELIFYRSIFGVITCFVVMHRAGISLVTEHPVRHFMRCAVGTFSLTLGVLVVTLMPLSLSQALINTSPLWFCLLLMAVDRPTLTRRHIALLSAVATGFVGILIILRPDVSSTSLSVACIGLLAGATGALADWLNRSLTHRGEPPERVVFYFTLSGTLLGACGAAIVGFSPVTFATASLLSGIGITGTLAQLALTYGWKGGHPILNAIFGFTAIPFAVLLGVIFLSEALDILSLIGIATVTLSGLAATLLQRRAEGEERNLKKKVLRC